MAVEVIEIEVDITTTGGDKIKETKNLVKTTIGEFENLNEAISKTQDELGKLDPKSKKFKDAAKDLAQLKDRLRETEAQSLRFTEALAQQPGVMGLVGQSLEGLRGTFKLFMANPIIAVVTGIAGAFIALKESLGRTEEGQAKLNKISEGFTKIMNGLFAVIEPIAMQLADLVSSLLENEKVMKGVSVAVGVLSGSFSALFGTLSALVNFVINNYVNAFNTLIDVSGAAGKVLKGVFTFDLDLINEGLGEVGDALKTSFNSFVDNAVETGNSVVTAVTDGFVDGFESGSTAFQEGAKRLTEQEKEAAKKAEEERKKRAEEAAKQRAADLEAANKILLEAELSLLDDRDRELKERELRFQEELKALKKAGITDLTTFEAEYRQDVLDINKRFDDEELKRQQDLDEKLKAQREKEAEEAKKKLEEYIQFQIDAKQFETEALELIQDQQISNIQGIGSILTQVAGKNKKLAIAGLVLEQGAAIGKVVIDTARAISSATAAAAPFMANPITAIPATANLARIIAQSKIAAGISIAGIVAGAAQGISQINQAQIPGASGGGGSAGGGGGGGALGSAPSFSAPQAMAAPQVQTSVGESPTSQIAQTIGMAQQKPMKAYVVSQDISSNQALDRRTNGAATFGG